MSRFVAIEELAGVDVVLGRAVLGHDRHVGPGQADPGRSPSRGQGPPSRPADWLRRSLSARQAAAHRIGEPHHRARRLQLGRPNAIVARLAARSLQEPLTLLTATKDVARSGAVVLAKVIESPRA